ncbi:MAG: hypothetical protein ACOZDY_13275 [Pseudomonadota bacterium]
MIEIDRDQLVFRFPEVHGQAVCKVEFQRTLRIPDDNRDYPLPPGLGRFPLGHVDDVADRVPPKWRLRGGVFLPMYQAEALWIRFSGAYPFALKIAAGKINAVTGTSWNEWLTAQPQDYVVSPEQPWLDGFCVAKGLIRQFVAMPLGQGYTAEEQLTGEGEFGGLQIIAYPLKRERYERAQHEESAELFCLPLNGCADMGLAPGGLMRQHLYNDPYGLDAWDTSHASRCFVHLLNSDQYHAVAGRLPPHRPPTAQEYAKAGLPWFEYYAEGKDALGGSGKLAGLDSIATKAIKEQTKVPFENDPVTPAPVINLGPRRRVREGKF